LFTHYKKLLQNPLFAYSGFSTLDKPTSGHWTDSKNVLGKKILRCYNSKGSSIMLLAWFDIHSALQILHSAICNTALELTMSDY